MKENISGKYLAVLALAAAAILFIGGRYRPHSNEPAPPSASETAVLQQSVRRDQAAGIGQYLASRAAELADQVIFVPERGTSGVRYGSSTEVLTVEAGGSRLEPALLVSGAPSELQPAPVATERTNTAPRNPDSWLLILGRAPDGEPLWTAFLHGVREASVCNEMPYQELVLNASLDPSFTGAGAYDLDGRLAGIAVPCGGALHIVAIASVPELLAQATAPERLFLEKFGFQAAPLPAEWQDVYPKQQGLLIRQVWVGGWAHRNGLLPGDLIVTPEAALQETIAGTELRVLRPGRPGVTRVKVDLAPNGTGIAILPAPAPLPELLIARGTPAEKAGLRNGDHLVAILGQRNPSVEALSRMLGGAGNTGAKAAAPVRIVYQRGNKLGVLEVPHE